MISQDISNITDSGGKCAYKDVRGLFLELDSTGAVIGGYGCRDGFASRFLESTSIIGFCKFEGYDLDRINEFFNTIHTKLCLPDNIIFHNTTIKNTFVVEVPEFWRCSHARRSFFTLFLRCAAIYYTGDFDAALNTYELSQSIKNAIDFFLDGNVNFIGEFQNHSGIVVELRNVSKEKLGDKLSPFDFNFEVKKSEYFRNQVLTS